MDLAGQALAQETEGVAPSQPQPTAKPASEPAAEPRTEALPCMTEEMKPGKEAKIDRFFPAPPEVVREALIEAMKPLEFAVEKSTESDLQAQRKRHFGAFVGAGGEFLNVHLAPAEENGVSGTRVSAATKKTFAGRVGQKNWTDAVLGRLDCLLQAKR
jgi:hypothetical protein